MDILRHRPLFSCCLAFMLAAVVGAALPLAGKVILGVMALSGAGAYLLLSRHRGGVSARVMSVLMAALLTCLALGQSHTVHHGREAVYLSGLEGSTVTAEGVVTDRMASGGNLTAYSLSLSSANGRTVRAKAYLTCHYVSDLRPGDRVSLTVACVPLEEAVGSADRALSLTGDGITMGLLSEGEEAVTVTGTDGGLSVRAGALRRSLAARLELAAGRDADGLASALLLGETSYLGDSLRRNYGRAGISHMLAISGLHVTLLFGLLDRLLRLFRVPKRPRGIAVCAAAIGYLILLGFPPSATRAVVMLGTVYLSSLAFARADSLTSLGLAGAMILAVNPFAVADAGFWMSFLATLGIVTVMPLLKERRGSGKGRHPLKTPAVRFLWALAVGGVAMSFTLLVVASVMGELGVLSPLSTVLLTPLCGVALVTSVLTLLLGWTPLAVPLGLLTGQACRLMNEIAACLGSPTHTVISLRHPAAVPVAALMLTATLVMLVIRLPRTRRGWVLAPMLAGWLLLGGILGTDAVLTRRDVEVSYLQPSSRSEAIVLVQGNRGFICDLSNGSLSAMTASAREAEKQGATEIAALMLTHYHSRTPGALSTLLERETVRALWLPTPTDGEDYFLLLSCLDKAETVGVPVLLYEAGEPREIFGTGTVTLNTASLARSVQPVLLVSVALRGETGEGHTLLYCGSAVFESGLSERAATLAASADTVIFGSHGPLYQAPFGQGFTCSRVETVILSAHGDTAAWLDPACLPDEARLWQGGYRTTLRP